IREASLIAETLGSDTAQSATRVAVIMRANRMKSCIAVSDEYHVFRIRKLLEHEGMRVYVAPRPDSRPRTTMARTQAVVREAGSYIAWRLRLLV
ncbi:MAG TPA: ElyC/SanA/YdcF family protein, partial [Terriglobales bacterium]